MQRRTADVIASLACEGHEDLAILLLAGSTPRGLFYHLGDVAIRALTWIVHLHDKAFNFAAFKKECRRAKAKKPTKRDVSEARLLVKSLENERAAGLFKLKDKALANIWAKTINLLPWLCKAIGSRKKAKELLESAKARKAVGAVALAIFTWIVFALGYYAHNHGYDVEQLFNDYLEGKLSTDAFEKRFQKLDPEMYAQYRADVYGK